MRLALWAAILLAGLIYGCSAGGTNNTTPPPSSNGDQLSGATGSVRVENAIPVPRAGGLMAEGTTNEIPTTAQFTGTTAEGRVIWGPRQYDMASFHVLAGVPVEVVQLECEYLAESGLVVLENTVALQVPANQEITVPADAKDTFKVEIVNDSGLPDNQVFVLLTVNPPAGAREQSVNNIRMVNMGNVPADVQACPLVGATDSPVDSGKTIDSPSGGPVRKIYQFSVTNVQGGRLLVSYGSAVTVKRNSSGKGADPTAYDNVRWDKFEFTYDQYDSKGNLSQTCYADLTALDFYGIPFQLESLRADNSVVDSKSFQASSRTIAQRLYGLDGNKMGYAFLSQGTKEPVRGWNAAWGAYPGEFQQSKFMRVLGPQVTSSDPWSATNTNPSDPDTMKFSRPYPAYPYPSFEGYLGTMTQQCYRISGLNGVEGLPPTGWDYRVTVNRVTPSPSPSPGEDPVKYRLDYAPNSAMVVSPAPTYGPPYGIVSSTDKKELPANLPVVVNLRNSTLDEFIYTTPATAFYVPVSCDLTKYVANSVYAVIANNLMAGLQFGYPNGVYGNDGNYWFQQFPVLYPFGAARATNDGLYNPFAAIFYNLSDAYGFPYSDRFPQFNPLLTTTPNGPNASMRMRLTMLSDTRMDAPQGLTCTTSTDTSATLSWEPAQGAKDYKVTWTCDEIHSTTMATGGATSLVLPGLVSGTHYWVSVQALDGKAQSCWSNPILASTTGAPPADPTGPTTAAFRLQLKWDKQLRMPSSSAILYVNDVVCDFESTVEVRGVKGSTTPRVIPFRIEASFTNPLFPKGTILDRGNFVALLDADGKLKSVLITDGTKASIAGTSDILLGVIGPNGAGPNKVPKVIRDVVMADPSPSPPPPSPCPSPTYIPPTPANPCPTDRLITVQALRPPVASGCLNDMSFAKGAIAHFTRSGPGVDRYGADDATAPLDENGRATFQVGEASGSVQPETVYTVWISSVGGKCGPFSAAAQGGFTNSVSATWDSSFGENVPNQINLQFGCGPNGAYGCYTPYPNYVPAPNRPPPPSNTQRIWGSFYR